MPVSPRPRAKKRLFLHVGTAKTGTTSLQLWLWRNRERLHQRGILYPRIRHESDQSIDFNRAHHLLAFHWGVGWFRENPAVTRAAWDDLARQAAGHEGDIIISSECFALALALHGESMFALIASLLPEHEIHVVIYLRDHEALIRADLFEALRNSQTGRSAWAHAMDPPWHLRALLDYRNLVSQARDNPAVRRVILRAFDRDSLVGGCICQDFRVALDLPRLDLPATGINANRFFDSNAIYLLLSRISTLRFSRPRQIKLKCYEIAAALGDNSGRFDWSPAFYDFLRARHAPDRAFLNGITAAPLLPAPRTARGHRSNGFEDRIARQLFHLVTGGRAPPPNARHGELLNMLSEMDCLDQLEYGP